MQILEIITPSKDANSPVGKAHIPVDKIGFVFKQTPLATGCMLLVGDAMVPSIRSFDGTESHFQGFIEFTTPEGGMCLVNPRAILFYTPTDVLGAYSLMFAGKIAVVVKATGQDLEKMFSELA